MKNKKNKGFTLVELIVVLVILAILAAILVPALLGYIDNAKNKQAVLNARSCMIAAQAELSSMYSKRVNTANLADTSDGHYKSFIATADTAALTPAVTKFYIGCEYKWNNTATETKANVHKMYTLNWVYYVDANGNMVELKDGEWLTLSEAETTFPDSVVKILDN